jgi:hypothetical protein
MQPLVKFGKTIRFKENPIVRRMLDLSREHGIGLNEILLPEYAQCDVEQFYQLLGYSLDMYAELSFVSAKSLATAKRRAQDIDKGKGYHLVLLARDHVKRLVKRFRDDNLAVMTFAAALDMADDTLGAMFAQEVVRERDLTHPKRMAFQNEFVRCLRQAKYIDPKDRKDPREDSPWSKSKHSTLFQDLDRRDQQRFHPSPSRSKEPGK